MKKDAGIRIIADNNNNGSKKKNKKKVSTATSDFGASARLNHDSTVFYNSRLYGDSRIDEKSPEVENAIPDNIINKALCQDSRDMSNIPDSSVHLMVTSPPYNVGKQYDEDLNLDEYFELLEQVFRETYRVLVSGGRACVNIANVGRKPYIPYHKYIIDTMTKVGFLMRGEIIWNKGAGAGVSTAWGSWKSPANPTLRDVHEYILIFSKEKFSRNNKNKNKIATITSEEFTEYTKSIWNFSPESAKKVGHPAPFPVELPYRCIQLYTFKNEVVLDPFCGVGSTCLAALKTDRRFIGLDLSEEYVNKAQSRILEVVGQSKLNSFIES